jgi:hypothetical protein
MGTLASYIEASASSYDGMPHSMQFVAEVRNSIMLVRVCLVV